MEKINRRPISEIATLSILALNWEKWGQEYKDFLDNTTTKKTGQNFSWRSGIYPELRRHLEEQTDEHCSFCDGFPIGESSKETIEHYEPKAHSPLLSYQWKNLFYCCDKCQSEANKQPFELTIKPDDADYSIKETFYFDLASGALKVLESLEESDLGLYNRASKFLSRYGINSPKRKKAREHLFRDVLNFLKRGDEEDLRQRKDFKYRHVFDYAKRFLNMN